MGSTPPGLGQGLERGRGRDAGEGEGAAGQVAAAEGLGPPPLLLLTVWRSWRSASPTKGQASSPLSLVTWSTCCAAGGGGGGGEGGGWAQLRAMGALLCLLIGGRGGQAAW
jgi:hypothetical protein